MTGNTKAETLLLHAGDHSDPATLEQRLAAFEGGAAALVAPPGQSAAAIALRNILQAGDNVVGSIGPGLAATLPAGVEIRLADPADPESFRRATDERTRAWYAETLPLPTLAVFPIREVARIGEGLGVPLIIDNTAAPVICRPLDHGAHIVVYSAKGYLGGGTTPTGGVIIDGGRFDWERHARRFPMLNRPDPSRHGTIWTEAARRLGQAAYMLRMRAMLRRGPGHAVAAPTARHLVQAMETLPLRMREHCLNAQAVAEFLVRHPGVDRVFYPCLDDGDAARRARKYLAGGFGGLVGFELPEGVPAAREFVEALRLFRRAAAIGETRSLAIHPASADRVPTVGQAACGPAPGYVGLSIGIEHIDDIMTDLSRALDAAIGAMAARRAA